jgi:hypothetical protein
MGARRLHPARSGDDQGYRSQLPRPPRAGEGMAHQSVPCDRERHRQARSPHSLTRCRVRPECNAGRMALA